MKRRSFKILSGLLCLALVTLACSISIPGQAPSEETLATSVAATFTAMAAPHSLPSEATPEVATVAPTTELPTATPSVATAAIVSAGRDLYVWRDGAPGVTRLTNSGDVDTAVVSPDGTLIAFVRSTEYINYQLDLIHSDGSGLTTLISFADFAAFPRPVDSEASIPYQLVWKPGTHSLFMNTRIQYMGPGLQVGENLYQINADSAARSTLMTVSGNWRFGFSPDGSKMTISHADGVDLYNSDGSLVRAGVISHALINTASEYQWTADPDWQADSSNFAVAIPPVEPFADTPADSSVYRVNTAGEASMLFTRAISFTSGKISTFDPNLSHIGYSERLLPATDNLWELNIANIDGSAAMTIATGYFSQLPVWSPDGSHFIFSNMSGSTRQAYLGTMDGSTALLADLPGLLDVGWLDSNRYLATNSTGAGYSLILGTVGSASAVLFTEPTSSGGTSLNFDTNR